MKNIFFKISVLFIGILFTISDFAVLTSASEDITKSDIVSYVVEAYDKNLESDSSASQIEVYYYPRFNKVKKYITLTYSDEFFNQDPSVYNHDLCRLSLCFALSSFRDDEASWYGETVVYFLEQAGFNDIETVWYDHKDLSADTLSSCFGWKKVGDSIVIAAVAAGAGYGNEWLGNLTVGDSDRAEGFNNAAQLQEERVKQYISKYGLNGNLKLWTAGFSRAAAAANIFAADMTDSGLFSDVYAYLFAVPRTTKNKGDYNNIFNIIGSNDVVPCVPLSTWGYERYGIDLYLPAQEYDSNYINCAIEADKVFQYLSDGQEFHNNPKLNHQLRIVLNYLSEIIKSSSEYVEELQPKIISAWNNHSSENLLMLLAETLKDMKDLPVDEQLAVNQLEDYINNILVQYLNGNYEQVSDGSWDTSTGIGNNIMLEHVPDVYASWILSDNTTEELYSDVLMKDTLRIVISGDFELTVYDEYGPLQDLDSFGNIAVDTAGQYGRSADAEVRFLETSRSGTQDIIYLPQDADYSIHITANANAEILEYAQLYSCGTLESSVSQLAAFIAEQGKEYILTVTTDEGVIVTDTEANAVYTFKSNLENSPDQLLSLEKLNDGMLSLTDVLKIAIIAAAVLLFAFIVPFIILFIHLHRHKKFGKRYSYFWKVYPHVLFMLISLGIIVTGFVILPGFYKYYFLGALVPVIMTVIFIIQIVTHSHRKKREKMEENINKKSEEISANECVKLTEEETENISGGYSENSPMGNEIVSSIDFYKDKIKPKVK